MAEETHFTPLCPCILMCLCPYV